MAKTVKLRPPPAYQEYASDMLANMQYRMMSLAERGLLDTMRKECWVNRQVPMKEDELASYLRIDRSEIEACLTSRVLSFFVDRAQFLICPELEHYREELLERQQKMVAGGQKGGKSTQKKYKTPIATLEAMIKPLSKDEMSGNETGKAEKQSLGEGITRQEMNEWVSDYESAPDLSASYMKLSKGS